MDREELVTRVTELTKGNAKDYLTRGDVGQIVDAVLDVQADEELARQQEDPHDPDAAQS